MDLIALFSVAILLGGKVFFSFGFAPVLFAQLPMDDVRPLLRGTFPYYYLSIIGLSAICAALAAPVSWAAAGLLLAICLTTIYARQGLMPKINAATDRADKTGFARLHGASVALEIIQIGCAGWALGLIAGV